MKIYISYGHNGKGTGAAKTFNFVNGPHTYDEGTMTREFVDYMRPMLADVPGIYFRDTKDLSATIKDVNAKTKTGDLAIEIHFNAGGGNGCECVVAETAGEKTRKFATELLSFFVNELAIQSRGVKKDTQSARGRLAFCRQTKCSAVIVEVCFIDNLLEMQRWDRLKKDIAKDLADFLANMATKP